MSTEVEELKAELKGEPADTEVDRMKALDRTRLPVGSLEEALPHLRRPFTPEAIRFKVQSVFKQQDGTPFGCLIVAYIDARLAIERLNRVIPTWSATYQQVDGKPNLMWCRLKIDGITRDDVGESPKGMSKDLVSDSLKRAAVHFGVGVSCYALPQIRLNVDQSGRLEVRGKGDKRTIVLTEHGHAKLREGYAKWLEEHGLARFGPPLDHGDVVGATIEEDAISAGEGDGTGPGWGEMPDDLRTAVEAVIERAKKAGHAALSDEPSIQMRLNGQPDHYVQGWLERADEELAQMEGEQEPPDAEVVEPQQETLDGS